MKTKISRAEYAAAYDNARKFCDGQICHADAIEALGKFGLNQTSATYFIANFRHMLKGEVYKRAMSAAATNDFIAWIRQDYKDAIFQNALSALRQHIDYRKAGMKSHVIILENYKKDRTSKTAVDDLDDPPAGNDMPNRASQVFFVIERDRRVRAYVIKRARGRCEYCNAEGFELPSGEKYIEAHHIIALDKDGRDTTENVIALCAGHHREAHYGSKAEILETKLIQRLREINRPPSS
jgi:hypothetical protein